jgi:mevalonate kinase
MPARTATAPGKIILFGEHAVVYGRPAIAIPVFQIEARASIRAEPRGAPGRIEIQAPGIGLASSLEDLPQTHPLAVAVKSVLHALQIFRPPACTIRLTSTIPIAAGLGSGAAISVALIRSLSAFLGQPLPDEQVSALAFEVEKVHHGTPSGIDNTVITYRRPVYFRSGQAIETFPIARSFNIVIGDTGIPSPTSLTVGDLRQRWQADLEKYEALFDLVGRIAQEARQSLEEGDLEKLAHMLNANHVLLREMGVSSTKLDRLVGAARSAGAPGAKLSGGGRGGNMIALASPQEAPAIAQALVQAGAVQTFITEVKQS